MVTGEWLEAYCRVILLDWNNLRPDEEDVRFASFSVQEVVFTN